MPRATREQQVRHEEQGGESGDPREVEQMTANGGPSGIRQPLPPLQQRDATIQAAKVARREAEDEIPVPRRFRVTKLPNEKGTVVGRDGRPFRVNMGKELDERYFDLPGMRRQGVGLEEIKEEG